MKNNISKEYAKYLRKKRTNKVIILSTQIEILVAFIAMWEILAKLKLIDTFILSCPSKILSSIKSLYTSGSLFHHIFTTLSEAIIGFLIATVSGYLIAIILWWNEFIRKVLDPYIVVLNSLPKIALGPIIIIRISIVTIANLISYLKTITR